MNQLIPTSPRPSPCEGEGGNNRRGKKSIYIFGNYLLDFDNVPLKLLPDLKKTFPDIDFIVKDPNENLHPVGGKLMIIDTVVGTQDVVIIEDIEIIEQNSSCSMHDFDLGFNLKLLKKIGRLDEIKIFGVPMHMEKENALEKLKELIKKYA